MRKSSHPWRLLVSVLMLTCGILLGAASVPAATIPVCEYAKVNYTKNIGLPITDHIWRVKFTNLNKAKAAVVSSSDTSVANAVIYSNTMKEGCIYLDARKAGKAVINVAFTYTSSSGKKIDKKYAMNLTVYNYENPLKVAKIGKASLSSKVAYTNYTTTANLCKGKGIVRFTAKKGWTVKGIYVQGLKKNGKGVVYTTVKIPNNKVYNFSVFRIIPYIYVQLYNSSKKMNLTVMFSGT